ncbi:MAG: sugar phosphate nucleotidyltransferase [Brevundimonas sp.]
MHSEAHLLVMQKAERRRSNSVVVMAGGFGRRLGDLTKNLPKPMIPVGGRPVLECILDRFRAHNFFDFILTTHYLPERIREHCGDGSSWGVDIRYVQETSPLGTAGGLALVKPTSASPIIVCNADILTDIDYSDLLAFHEEMEADLTVVSVPHPISVPFGVLSVSPDGRIVGVSEKPTYSYPVSAGTYVINPKLLTLIEPGERLDMPHLIERAQARGFKVFAYGFDGYWLDIGRPEDLHRARQAFIEHAA